MMSEKCDTDMPLQVARKAASGSGNVETGAERSADQNCVARALLIAGGYSFSAPVAHWPPLLLPIDAFLGFTVAS